MRSRRRSTAASPRGAEVLPPAPAIFSALRLTPLERVRVVILGQDPYPTPGDAHGLAFSYVGRRRLPPSLKTILAEMADDLGCPAPTSGDLTPLGAPGRASPQHRADRRGGRRRRASPARLVGARRRGRRGGLGAAASGRVPSLGRAGAQARGARSTATSICVSNAAIPRRSIASPTFAAAGRFPRSTPGWRSGARRRSTGGFRAR